MARNRNNNCGIASSAIYPIVPKSKPTKKTTTKKKTKTRRTKKTTTTTTTTITTTILLQITSTIPEYFTTNQYPDVWTSIPFTAPILWEYTSGFALQTTTKPLFLTTIPADNSFTGLYTFKEQLSMTTPSGWWSHGCDFQNHNLYSYALILSLSDCLDTCIETYFCTHYTFDSYTGKCWLKGGNVKITDSIQFLSKNLVCGIVKSSVGQLYFMNSTTSVGTTTATKSTSSSNLMIRFNTTSRNNIVTAQKLDTIIYSSNKLNSTFRMLTQQTSTTSFLTTSTRYLTTAKTTATTTNRYLTTTKSSTATTTTTRYLTTTKTTAINSTRYLTTIKTSGTSSTLANKKFISANKSNA